MVVEEEAAVVGEEEEEVGDEGFLLHGILVSLYMLALSMECMKMDSLPDVDILVRKYPHQLCYKSRRRCSLHRSDRGFLKLGDCDDSFYELDMHTMAEGRREVLIPLNFGCCRISYFCIA